MLYLYKLLTLSCDVVFTKSCFVKLFYGYLGTLNDAIFITLSSNSIMIFQCQNYQAVYFLPIVLQTPPLSPKPFVVVVDGITILLKNPRPSELQKQPAGLSLCFTLKFDGFNLNTFNASSHASLLIMIWSFGQFRPSPSL